MPLHDVVQLALAAQRERTSASSDRRLSPREEQICELVADGLTNREIAVRLHLIHHTVDNHMRRIFGKVGVSSHTSLATWSVRQIRQ